MKEHSTICKLNDKGFYIRKTPAHRDEISVDEIDLIHKLIDEPFDKLHRALAALTEWGRTYTSPADPNSPHQLLINAVAALEAADKEQE